MTSPSFKTGNFALMQKKLLQVREIFNQSSNLLKDKADQQYTGACAQLMVDCYSGMLTGHLLLDQLEFNCEAGIDTRKLAIAKRFIAKCLASSKAMLSLVESDIYTDLNLKEQLLNSQ